MQCNVMKCNANPNLLRMCPCATTLVTTLYMHYTTQELVIKMHTPSTVLATPALIVPAWWGQRGHMWCKSHLFVRRSQGREGGARSLSFILKLQQPFSCRMYSTSLCQQGHNWEKDEVDFPAMMEPTMQLMARSRMSISRRNMRNRWSLWTGENSICKQSVSNKMSSSLHKHTHTHTHTHTSKRRKMKSVRLRNIPQHQVPLWIRKNVSDIIAWGAHRTCFPQVQRLIENI